jgi:undecaprenyl-diphosphatase
MSSTEESLFRAINSLAGHSFLVDRAMILLSDPSTWTLASFIFLIFVIKSKNKKMLAFFLAALISLAISDLISFEIVKPLVGRERPCWMLEHVTMILGKCGGSYGFTSNHAANAFAVWIVTAKTQGLRSWQSLLLITIAFLVSLSRVFLGVHFVGDVVGGAILGILVGFSLYAIGLHKWTTQISEKVMN